MASRGRGIYMPLSKRAIHANPAKDCEKLVELIKSYNVNEASLEVQNMFIKLASNYHTMETVIATIHDICLDDNNFAYKFIISFKNLYEYTIDEVSVRNLLLTKVQRDYNERQDMRCRDKTKFKNSIILLAYIYHYIRVGGRSIEILLQPVVDYIYMVIDFGDGEEFQALATQIFLNGGIIKKKTEDTFASLLTNLRKCVSNRYLTPDARNWLMFSIDCCRDLQLSRDISVDSYYKLYLTDSYDVIERLIPYEQLNFESAISSLAISETITPSLTDRVRGRSISPTGEESYDSDRIALQRNSSISLQLQKDVITCPISKKMFEKKSRHERNWREGEKLKRDVDIWESGKSPEYSRHDDRFYKDEAFYGTQLKRPQKEN